MQPHFIPEGLHTVTPYLNVEGAGKVVTFLEKAFDAKAGERISHPDGKIGHVQVKVGDSTIMLSDVCGEMKPTVTMLYLYVPDVDATYKRAIEAGATSIMEPTNQFYGDRSGAVKDASGTTWWIATRVEEIPLEQLQERARALWDKRSK